MEKTGRPGTAFRGEVMVPVDFAPGSVLHGAGVGDPLLGHLLHRNPGVFHNTPVAADLHFGTLRRCLLVERRMGVVEGHVRI